MKPTSGIAALAFFAFALFGSGMFLHGIKPVPAAETAKAKPAPHAHSGKGKSAGAKAALKTAAPATVPENSVAFPLMVAGGIGLLLAALAGLNVIRSLGTVPQAAHRKPDNRLLEAEQAARHKQKEEFEIQQAALQAQLQEARQRKAETEALRDQVSRQFQEFFRTLPVPCFCFAANGRIIRWNAACETLYGIPAATALESTLWETIVPDSEREEAEAKICRVLSGEPLLEMERWDTLAGGALTRLRCSMVPLYDADGQIIGGLSAGVDATEYARQEEQIAELTTALEAARAEQAEASLKSSNASVLIGSSPELSGHTAFRDRLSEEIARASRYHGPLSLVLFDLDNFAARNRSLGYQAGDEALEAVVAVIKSKIRTVDVIARLGADEYAVILPETGEAGARVAAERLRTGIAGASVNGQPPLTASFGVAQLTPDVAGMEELVSRVWKALAEAQSGGANSVVHYQDLPEAALTGQSYSVSGRQPAR